MPISTIISEGRTTVPKEVREALDLHPGDQLTWAINDGHVLITKRPALFRWKGNVKHGPRDVVKAIHEARKRRGHF